MKRIFSRFGISWLIGMVSLLSFSVFLGVIALNYHAIGDVQEMNEHLLNSPMSDKDRWHGVAMRLTEAERMRLHYLADHNARNTANLPRLMAEIRQEINALQDQTAHAMKGMLESYERTFGQLVANMEAGQSLRTQMVKEREALESLVYETDNRSLESALGELLLAEMAYFADKRPEQVRAVLVLLDRFSRDAAGSKWETSFAQTLAPYRHSFETIVANTTRIQEQSKEMESQALQITATVRQGLKGVDASADDAVRAARQQAKTAQQNALIWTALGVAAAVVLFMLFARALGNRVKITLDGLEALARGDLRFRFDVAPGARNELCHIMETTNHMSDSLSTLLRMVLDKISSIHHVVQRFERIKVGIVENTGTGNRMISDVTRRNVDVDGTTHSVYEFAEKNEVQTVSAEQAARNFLKIIQEMARGAEEAGANVNTMAAAAEEMTANVEEVNGNLNRVGGSVSTVAAAVEELDASLAEVRQRCRLAEDESKKAGTQVEEAEAAMRKLDHAAREIGKVVQVINHIAGQTNLLALNAGIEAAGAGEAGRGFAVVAGEVKELAKETAKATRMIADRVEEVQSIVREAGGSMQRVVGGIDRVMQVNGEIVQAVDEQSNTSREIARSMGDVTLATQAVTHNAAELAEAAREVARAAADVARGTGAIARSTSAAVKEAGHIAENAATTQQQSHAIKVKTKDIFANSGDVQKLGLVMYDLMVGLGTLAEEMADLTNSLRQGADELALSTREFTIQS